MYLDTELEGKKKAFNSIRLSHNLLYEQTFVTLIDFLPMIKQTPQFLIKGKLFLERESVGLAL